MSESQILTQQLVNSLSPPDRGEKWIGDKVVTGFGVRLWATPSGGSKAFAIRVTSATGEVVRKTYPFSVWESRSDIALLGDYLSTARLWARTEISQLKGLPTPHEIETRRRMRAAQRRGKHTLQEEVEILIQQMRRRKLSQAYIDRLDKLFSVHIPKGIRSTTMANVSPEALAGALVSKEISASNIRVLRSFFWQVVQNGPLRELGQYKFSERFTQTFWERWEENVDVRFPELRNLKDADYKKIFSRLEKEKVYWQQALCIRLFFIFGAPLSRLMQAQWAQCFAGFWYPYSPGARVTWFMQRQRIEGRAANLLKRLHKLVDKHFGRSRYWFPSQHGRTSEHIRTIEPLWCAVLHDVGSRYYPLREFAMSFRPPSTPSYHMTVFPYFEAAQRELDEEIGLSKRLKLRLRSQIDSSSYL